MPAPPRHLELVPASAAPAPACASPDCRLPAAHKGRCAHCTAVYKAALVLHDELAAREMARLELDHPGLERAARIALRAAFLRHEHSAPVRSAAVPREGPARGGRIGDPLLLDWRVARLERFIAELRGLVTEHGGPA